MRARMRTVTKGSVLATRHDRNGRRQYPLNAAGGNIANREEDRCVLLASCMQTGSTASVFSAPGGGFL